MTPQCGRAAWEVGRDIGGTNIRAEEEGLSLAPFIGVGCPGFINEDGSIERGGQNLPGNWESSRFAGAPARGDPAYSATIWMS